VFSFHIDLIGANFVASAAAAHARDSQTSTQDRKAKTKSAMTLLIHRVEILKPQSNCHEHAITRFDRSTISVIAIYQQ
jgi:hypothetical protein